MQQYPPTDGQSLKARRENAGISQDDIAERIGTTRQALRRWEQNPRLTYVKAARYLAALDDAVAEKVPGKVA